MKVTHLILLVGGLAGAPLLAQVPEIITYSGQVTSNGEPFEGVGRFKFALLDGENGVSLWSNDGSSVNGSEPTEYAGVTVIEGRFTLGLGDTDLSNMTAVSPGVFSHPDVRLRIWFDDGESGFAQLSPDQRITANAYAMMAASVPDGAITAAKLAPDAVDDGHIGAGVIGDAELADGSVTTPKLADGAVTTEKLADGAITADKIADNALTSETVANTLTLERLNLGGIDWDGRLHLYSQPDGGGGGILNPAGDWRGFLEADPFGSELDLFMSDGTTGAVFSARSPGGRVRLWDGTGRLTAILGTVNGGGDLNLFQLNEEPGVRLNGDRSTFDNQTASGGEISVHTRGGQVGVLIDGDHQNAGRIEVGQPNGTYVDIFGRGANDAGEIWIHDSALARRVELQGLNGTIRLRAENTTPTLELVGDNGELVATAAVGVANTVDAPLLQASLALNESGGAIRTRAHDGTLTTFARSTASGGLISVHDASGDDTLRLIGAQQAGTGARLEMTEAGGQLTVVLDAEGGTGGGFLSLRKSDGTQTVLLDADSNGSGRVTTDVLEITGGSDLAERFDVYSPAATPTPGMVVCIDPVQPGRLVTCTSNYDRTVAGVISGAGGVKPGMLMGQSGTVADGAHPVALTGRVYCLVDAAIAPVQPGDLLTTSDTPGHAMKASDHSRAQGAILGKAMSGLDQGRGLVLVLVSLQ